MSLRFPFDTPPEPGAAVEVAEGILWLRLPLPMALDHVNVYALADADGWTLIDTGMNSRKTRDIWRPLWRAPLRARRWRGFFSRIIIPIMWALWAGFRTGGPSF